MAPSQRAKMVRIEGITAPVFTSTVREDFVKGGLSFMVGEDRIIFVQSARFTGWYYLVRWSTDGIDYCTCGKPNGCVHTRAACVFTATYRAPVRPVVACSATTVEQVEGFDLVSETDPVTGLTTVTNLTTGGKTICSDPAMAIKTEVHYAGWGRELARLDEAHAQQQMLTRMAGIADRIKGQLATAETYTRDEIDEETQIAQWTAEELEVA
jgi:hypothetical protein